MEGPSKTNKTNVLEVVGRALSRPPAHWFNWFYWVTGLWAPQASKHWDLSWL